MAVDVLMPQMGESVVEGTVAKWLVNQGDRVEEGQPLLEISTDKVDTEIPSPASGAVAHILVREGETVPVGARLAVLEEAATAAGPPAHAPAGGASAAPSEAAFQTSAAAEPKRVEPTPPASEATPEQGAREEVFGIPATDRSPPPSAPAHEPPRLSPVVAKMAAEHDIDVTQISGSGIGGRVTKRDLLAYLESRKGAPPSRGKAGMAAPAQQPSASAPSAPPRAVPPGPSTVASLRAPAITAPYTPPAYEPREGDIVEPFSRRRRIIAEHMVYSKTHAPHVGIVAQVDLTQLARFRDAHKDAFRSREGFSLTFLPIVAMAAIRALKEYPRMNASVVGDSLVVRKEINLGVAVDSEEGLVVPVIKSADQKSLLGIAREIEAMRRKTVEKRLTADDLAGGSFTVSNPGREGNLFGFAIINQPQVAILRMGEVRKEPVVIERDGEDAIAIRTVMYLTCSYDHRVVDGVLGNRFLYKVARLLETAEFEL